MAKERTHCLFCNKPFFKNSKDHKFCDRTCANKYRYVRPRQLYDDCQNCGVSIKGSKSKAKFCSRDCAATFRYKEYITRWLRGEEDGMKGEQVSLRIRRWLVETRSEQCALCGWHEINVHTGNIPLTVEHIDGNYRNNRPENLKLLCPNCHSLTPTYGGANKGNGRVLRRRTRQKTQKYKNREVYDLVRNATSIKNSEVVCTQCSEPFTLTSSRRAQCCSIACATRLRYPNVNKPSKEELAKAVWETPTSKLALRYGVSDVAVAKWCRTYGIDKPPRGYWAKLATRVRVSLPALNVQV